MTATQAPAGSAQGIAVPRLWPGETFAILGSGPSLMTAPRVAMSSRCRVIAVKDAIRVAPWADVLYGGDVRWWRHHAKSLDFRGPRYGIDVESWPWTTVLRNTGILGLETDPTGLRTGKHSGYQAINLAVHLGARRIVLLGFDMKADAKGQDHWFGPHPYPTLSPPYHALREIFGSIVEPLAALRIQVVNATPGSALECFPQASLAEALG